MQESSRHRRRLLDSKRRNRFKTGEFQTVPVPLNTPVVPTYTDIQRRASATIAGNKFAITCTGGSGQNAETGVTMKVLGSEGHVRFEGCAVT